jgi:hypothetical protein
MGHAGVIEQRLVVDEDVPAQELADAVQARLESALGRATPDAAWIEVRSSSAATSGGALAWMAVLTLVT